jgi:predicted ArsR family transcriptional regulator
VKKSVTLEPQDDLRTRDRVARSILENGPTSATLLAARLGFTPAGIRRHLDALVSDGVLEAREPHVALMRGRGRPSKVFVMTDAGREKFEHTYDDLAVSALKFMAINMGEGALKRFAESRASDIEKTLTPLLQGAIGTADRSAALAEFLTQEGFAASVTSKSQGEELCQHHCPVAHIAAAFPQLCEAETEAFSRLLGTHVQRLATIAHGDGVCTTFVPRALKSDLAATSGGNR